VPAVARSTLRTYCAVEGAAYSKPDDELGVKVAIVVLNVRSWLQGCDCGVLSCACWSSQSCFSCFWKLARVLFASASPDLLHLLRVLEVKLELFLEHIVLEIDGAYAKSTSFSMTPTRNDCHIQAPVGRMHLLRSQK
jgi:hypothetical protein